MPRATQSKEAGILGFFKLAELPIAQLVLTLATDAVKERLTRSAEAKARAARPTTGAKATPVNTPVAPAAATAAPKVKGKKRRKRAKATKTAAAPATPPAEQEFDLPGDQG